MTEIHNLKEDEFSSDNNTQVTNAAVGYHQSSGLVAIMTLEVTIRTTTADIKGLVKVLQKAVSAHNAATRHSSGTSPFKAIFGHDTVTPR